jgi:glycosyltransferase involved in cell wall biosynthesis
MTAELSVAAPELISVIMPCFNAAPYVEEAVGSALGQSHGNVELIIVDDGSTDGSQDILAELVQRHPGRIHLFHTDRAGPYPARNLALQHAHGVFIAFLDADDWWREDCLEKLHGAIRETQADVAYCGWQNVGGRALNSEPYVPPAYEQEDTVADFLKGCPWPIHAALTRRSVIDAVNGFSEQRYASMDYDLWLRILAHTHKMIRVPEVLAFYRWHGSGQVSASKWRQVLDAVQVRRDFVSHHRDLVAHLPRNVLYELVDGQIMREAYRAYWRRDLGNAQKLFREAIACRAWQPADLKYLLPAMLPAGLFRELIGFADRSEGKE